MYSSNYLEKQLLTAAVPTATMPISMPMETMPIYRNNAHNIIIIIAYRSNITSAAILVAVIAMYLQ